MYNIINYFYPFKYFHIFQQIKYNYKLLATAYKV